jgi:hypothetical protein
MRGSLTEVSRAQDRGANLLQHNNLLKCAAATQAHGTAGCCCIRRGLLLLAHTRASAALPGVIISPHLFCFPQWETHHDGKGEEYDGGDAVSPMRRRGDESVLSSGSKVRGLNCTPLGNARCLA